MGIGKRREKGALAEWAAIDLCATQSMKKILYLVLP